MLSLRDWPEAGPEADPEAEFVAGKKVSQMLESVKSCVEFNVILA